MKKLLSIIACVTFSVSAFAQTPGTMTFKFTEAAGTATSKNIIAVWIENNAGTFIKTRIKYAVTEVDHLPSWAVKSGGTASNSSAAACNVVGATTGATLTSTSTPTSMGAKTITWDGTNAAGTIVADGIYKVWVETSWLSGTAANSHGSITSYSFTKGAVVDNQAPAGATITSATYSAITVDWVPTSGVGVAAVSANPELSVYPNPSNGVFNVNFYQVNNIKVINTLGAVVYEEKVDPSTLNKSIDLSTFANGIYFISVSNDKGTSNQKVILDK